MRLSEERRENLSTVLIRRAYWAMNSIHNKVFFNRSNNTYVTPDREDKIVAMLTEQKPEEVALLRITRELIEQAEKEQPERKISLMEQNKNIMNVELEGNEQQEQGKAMQQEARKIEERQEKIYEREQVNKREFEEEEINEDEMQEERLDA